MKPRPSGGTYYAQGAGSSGHKKRPSENHSPYGDRGSVTATGERRLCAQLSTSERGHFEIIEKEDVVLLKPLFQKALDAHQCWIHYREEIRRNDPEDIVALLWQVVFMPSLVWWRSERIRIGQSLATFVIPKPPCQSVKESGNLFVLYGKPFSCGVVFVGCRYLEVEMRRQNLFVLPLPPYFLSFFWRTDTINAYNPVLHSRFLFLASFFVEAGAQT